MPLDQVNKFVCHFHQMTLDSQVSGSLRYPKKLHDKPFQRLQIHGFFLCLPTVTDSGSFCRRRNVVGRLHFPAASQ